MRIETVYDVGQRVKIVEPDIHGRVVEISIGYGTVSYKVEFWTSGESKVHWAKEFEIAPEVVPAKVGLPL